MADAGRGRKIGGGTITNDRGDKVGTFDIIHVSKYLGGGMYGRPMEHIVYRDNHGKALRGKNRQRAEGMNKVYDGNSGGRVSYETQSNARYSIRNGVSLKERAANYRRAKAEGLGEVYKYGYKKGLIGKYATNQGGTQVSSKSRIRATNNRVTPQQARAREIKKKYANSEGRGITRTYGGNANSRWDRINKARQAKRVAQLNRKYGV